MKMLGLTCGSKNGNSEILIVDQIQVMGAGMRGSVLVNLDGAVQRARQLGRNIAEQIGKHFDDLEYKGDNPGTCPDSNLLAERSQNGIRGFSGVG